MGHECLEKIIHKTHNQYFYYARRNRNIKINSHNRNRYPLLYKQTEISTSSFGQILECRKCNILVVTWAFMLSLPDMYALSPWACGPQALGIHIRQSTRAHVTTITYNIPRKCNLLPLVPYKGTYHMLLNGIHTSYITEVYGQLYFYCGKSVMDW